MILRYVQLELDQQAHMAFQKTFKEVRDLISGFPGCHGVELYRGTIESPNVFATLSKWDSKEHLDHYRNSELFRSTWSKVKLSFIAKPIAYSFEVDPL